MIFILKPQNISKLKILQYCLIFMTFVVFLMFLDYGNKLLGVTTLILLLIYTALDYYIDYKKTGKLDYQSIIILIIVIFLTLFINKFILI